jgi:hypothetical protein
MPDELSSAIGFPFIDLELSSNSRQTTRLRIVGKFSRTKWRLGTKFHYTTAGNCAGTSLTVGSTRPAIATTAT